MLELTEEVRAFLARQRVGHLATADAGGVPSVVPICYHLQGATLYSAVDEKPKQQAGRRLRRIRNLLATPAAAVVVDRWDEDWRRLGWVLLRGSAAVMEDGAEHERGVALLRAKYPQYRRMRLEGQPMIVLTVETVRHWGDLSGAPGP